MAQEEVLYSERAQIGTEVEDPIEEKEILLYLKVGLFCGWSWQEYMATPNSVIKRISEEIDFRLENPEATSLNWYSCGTSQALCQIVNAVFGKKE
jgi:hypothetical protein